MDSSEIKIFKASELQEWLSTGSATFTEQNQFISPARALAFINNPFVYPDDPIACALFTAADNGVRSLVAFTAAFPDMVGDQRMWWFSTLWCHPSHRGRGYPLFLVGTLAEIYGPENCLDTMGAPETIEIFRFLGHRVSFIDEHRFGCKISRQGLLGHLLYTRELALTLLRRIMPRVRYAIRNTQYTLQYTDIMDQGTYNFIQQRADNDLFPRSQQMFNWILSYPLKRCAPLAHRTANHDLFGDSDLLYWLRGVKVLHQGRLVGFYILRNSESDLSVKYLYYDLDHRERVFVSIMEHVLAFGNSCFCTRHAALAQFIGQYRLFSRHSVTKISLSCPERFELNPNAISQGGDGDCFA